MLAFILGLLTVGETRIEGLLESDEILAVSQACRQLGATIERAGPESWRVHGVGVGGVLAPEDSLDFGRSAMSAMLMMGVVASHGVTALFDGNEDLHASAMLPVLAPLTRMGAEIVTAAAGDRLPLTLRGAVDPVPILHRLPDHGTAPARTSPDLVKATVLLAGLNAPGETAVIEPQASEGPLEELFRQFGAGLDVQPEGAQGRRIVLQGRPTLKPTIVTAPPPRKPSIAS